MTIGGIRLGWLRRRWWVVLICMVGVTSISLVVNRPAPVTFTGETVLIVRSGATENTPGSANEANRLAITYSQLIPQDSETLNSVSSALGVSRDDVADALTATNDANTSILRVRYTADNANEAVNGARAVADALVGATPAASNFSGLGLSRLPDTATRNESSGTALPVGLILGFLLGAVIVIAIERSNGRIDSITDVEGELSCPVTSLQGLSAGSILSLLQRWKTLATSSPVDVAVVTGAQGQRALSQEVSVVFATTAVSEDANGNPVALISEMNLHATGAPSTWEVGEAAVQQSNLVVLVVAEGTHINELRKTVAGLEDFGVKPAWALFASDAVVRRARRHHGIGEATTVAIGSSVPQSLTT